MYNLANSNTPTQQSIMWKREKKVDSEEGNFEIEWISESGYKRSFLCKSFHEPKIV